MRGLFLNCFSIKLLPDISKWNTNNVTDMDYIFDGCSKLSVKPVFKNQK